MAVVHIVILTHLIKHLEVQVVVAEEYGHKKHLVEIITIQHHLMVQTAQVVAVEVLVKTLTVQEEVTLLEMVVKA